MTQVLRGIGAVPEAVMSPRQGKWWNEATHQWVYTDLSKAEVPESDEDILGTLKAELDASGKPTGAGAGTVKDTYYYDLLEVRFFDSVFRWNAVDPAFCSHILSSF